MSDENTGGGVNVGSGSDATVGGDVAGRDKITTTTTHVGFGPKDVQRLIIAVGVMVFITAACFFSGGVAVGGAAFVALSRPVNSNNEVAADRFESFLAELGALPPGQLFILNFTEEEISSYFRLRLAPQMGVTDGKVRLLDETTQLLVAGRASDLSGLPFAATFELRDTPGAPLRLTSAAVQVLQLKDKDGKVSSFGWMYVPTPAAQFLADNLNSLFSNVQLTAVAATGTHVWTVSGVAR